MGRKLKQNRLGYRIKLLQIKLEDPEERFFFLKQLP